MKTELSNILNLIAVTILADKRIYASEIETFIKATSQLDAVKSLEPKISEARLLSWYELNKADIQEKIATPYFKDWFYKLLDQLAHIPEKKPILDVMKSIAEADGEVHVSERALMTLAERYWRAAA